VYLYCAGESTVSEQTVDVARSSVIGALISASDISFWPVWIAGAVKHLGD